MQDAASAWRRELRRRFRTHAFGALAWAVLATVTGLIGHWFPRATAGSPIRETEAEVLALPVQGSERRIALAWIDADGVRHRAEHPAWYAPDARVGDRIPYLYDTTDPTFARPLSAGDRGARTALYGLAVAVGGGALAWLGLAALQAARRADLVRRGERLQAHALAVEHEDLGLGRAGTVRRWRIRGAWFDDALPGWRTLHSAWQAGDPPAHAARGAVVLRLPGTHRAWLPLPVDDAVDPARET